MSRKTDAASDDRGLSRRGYASLLAAGAAGSLAGCIGDSGGAGAAGSETDRAERLTVYVDNSLDRANIHEWAESRDTGGFEFLTELFAPESAATWERLLSGTEFDAGWVDGADTVTIPTMLEDYEVEPPHDVYEYYDDRLTYWDGTALDAEARLAQEEIYYYRGDDGYNSFNESTTLDAEVVDTWEYHHWTPKGQAPGQATNPRSAPVLENQLYSSQFAPMHPDFTGQYLEQYRDATSRQAVQDVTAEMAQHRVGFEAFAENGWGSGLYELESTDDVTEDGLIARLRDDHPNEHADLEELEIRFASPDQQTVAREAGAIDIGNGVVGDASESDTSTSAHVGQIDRTRGDGGDKVLFDMNDHHLGRLWVRRAFVALVDWTEISSIAWGEGSSHVSQHDTGLHHTLSEETFSEEFLDDLHRYPRESDVETALDYLERAGYTGSREDGWTSPDGQPLEITITADRGIAPFVRASQLVRANLLSIGVETELDFVDQSPGYETKLDAQGGIDYQIAFMWDQFTEPWQFYWTQGGWWQATLLGARDLDHPWDVPAGNYGEFDTHGLPMEPELPSQRGAIDAPRRAGRAPDLVGGRQVQLPPTVHAMRDPNTSEEEFQELYETCAQVYNFYLPQFRFHDYSIGPWGNLRDFEYPEVGHELNHMKNPAEFMVRAGVPQWSDDTDWEPRDTDTSETSNDEDGAEGGA